MIAVFFTFALSGPLPPKEMGVILGVAVLLDAILIRLGLAPCRSPPPRPDGLDTAELARAAPARRPLRPLVNKRRQRNPEQKQNPSTIAKPLFAPKQEIGRAADSPAKQEGHTECRCQEDR